MTKLSRKEITAQRRATAAELSEASGLPVTYHGGHIFRCEFEGRPFYLDDRIEGTSLLEQLGEFHVHFIDMANREAEFKGLPRPYRVWDKPGEPVAINGRNSVRQN